MSIRNEAEYQKALKIKEVELLAMAPNVKRQEMYALKTMFTVLGGNMQSGDSFGDIAFRVNGLRAATSEIIRFIFIEIIVITTRTSECLVFTKKDYERLMASIPEASDSQSKLFAFRATSPLFYSLSFEENALTRYCDIRNVSPSSCVLLEGEIPDHVNFIRTGECCILKSVHYIRETMLDGKKKIHRLPIEFQKDAEQKLNISSVSIPDVRNIYNIKVTHETSVFHHYKKLVLIDTIGPGKHFGVYGDFIDSGKRSIEKKSGVTIVAKGLVELIGMSIIDFQRFGTSATSEVLFLISYYNCRLLKDIKAIACQWKKL